MLRGSFRGLGDLEELYQEAWTEALELQAEGQEIRDIAGLLRTIAWRRGRDRLRNQRPLSVDPTGFAITGRADDRALPEEEVEVELDAALIWQVVESLEPREAAVIKMRFSRQMNAHEMQRELGISAKRLEKIVTRAYSQVEGALTARDGEEPEWRRRQRSLLLACETGLASAKQRRQAGRMVREDPACRAMLAEIRTTLEGVAAVLPLPLLVGDAALGRLARFKLELGDRWVALREQLAEYLSRVTQHSSSVEQAGAGGAASIGGGMALKAALTCVAVGGTTVVCLTTALPDKPAPDKPRAEKLKPARVSQSTRAPIAVARISPTVAIPPRRAERREPVVKAAAPAAASPAPASSTEFGPGAIGSSPAPTTPAAAPDNGSDEFTP
jgi:RNA polymerase sigma factor (sigma-70 family)